MNASPVHDWSELDRLIDGACDATLSADERTELSRWLIDRPEARERYLASMGVHGALAWQMMPSVRLSSTELRQYTEAELDLLVSETGRLPAAPASAAPSFVSAAWHGTIGFFSQEAPFAGLIAAAIVSVGLAVASRIYISHPEPLARHSFPAPVTRDPLPELVGRITGMVDCTWSADCRAPYGYDSVPIGRQFALDSGLMQITYKSGAKVILQGPCTYEVDSAAGGFLSLGKLTARVGSGQWAVGSEKPQAANHKSEIVNHKSPSLSTTHYPLFTIKTPTAVITDLGTEFGVEVDGGVTRSHVFQGRVEVASHFAGSGQSTIQLNEHESLIVGRSGIIQSRQAVDGSRFVRSLSFRPFPDLPELSEATVVFSEPFSADSLLPASDYPGLIFGSIGQPAENAPADIAQVRGGFLQLRHDADVKHTENVMTAKKFSGRMVVSVDIGADGTNGGKSHVALLLGDLAFQFHPGYSEFGMRGAFRITEAGQETMNDNIDMEFIPAVNVLHHLFVHYDGRRTFRACLVSATDHKSVFRTTFVYPDCSQTFPVGVSRSGYPGTGWFDNLRVIQLPDEDKDAVSIENDPLNKEISGARVTDDNLAK